MGTAATKAKRKWNKEHYTNITVAMNPELAAKLKAICIEKGVSVSGVITGLVEGYLDVQMSSPHTETAEKYRQTDTPERKAESSNVAGK